MATAVLDPFVPKVAEVVVEYDDYHQIVKSAGFTLRTAWPGFSGADDAAKTTAVAELATLIDPITHCRICEIMVSRVPYLIGGEAADNAAHWFEVSDEVVLQFRSAARCRVTKELIILGPVDSIFTGVEQIIVNPAAVVLAPLITFLELHLTETRYGQQDFKFKAGYRRKVALPVPNVA